MSAQLLTVKVACSRLSIGRSKLNELFRAGKLTKVCLGARTVRVREDEIDRYIASCARSAPVQRAAAAPFDANAHFDSSNNPFL